MERTWQVARTLFTLPYPKRPEALFSTPSFASSKGEGDHCHFHHHGSSAPETFLGQITKDLRLLLGDHLQVNLASFDGLLKGNK